MRAHAAARGRMPPVLHVPLAELAAGGAEKMLAQQAGLGMHQGHGVLQLIAKAERAAGLVEPGPRPHAAGERLVDQPAVGQEVDGRVGRFDVDRAERPAPVVPNAFQGLVGVAGAAEALNKLPGLLFAAGRAEDEDDFLFLAVLERRPGPAWPRRDRARRRRGRTAERGAWPRGSPACRCGRGTPCGRRSRVRIVSLLSTKTTRSANSGL